MKSEANQAPNRIVVERYDGKADIVLCENIELIDKDGESAYIFDTYRLTITDRPNIVLSIESNFDAWLQVAKDAESVPKPKTVEQRVGTVEVTTDEIVDVLATIVGV